jgi:hypothetical protein
MVLPGGHHKRLILKNRNNTVLPVTADLLIIHSSHNASLFRSLFDQEELLSLIIQRRFDDAPGFEVAFYLQYLQGDIAKRIQGVVQELIEGDAFAVLFDLGKNELGDLFVFFPVDEGASFFRRAKHFNFFHMGSYC